MIKLLIFTLAGFVVYSMVTSALGLRPKRRQPRNRSQQGEQMVEDPQCGTYLPLSDAVSATIDGKTRYFCSKSCLKAYRKEHKS